MSLLTILRWATLWSLVSLTLGVRTGYSSTSGPSAPEVGAFTPVETGNLVNLSSGQFTYSLPLIQVPGSGGGYSMALGYASGIRLEQEASWVGLGWSLQPGAVTRSVVGVPDDFCGQVIQERSLNTKVDLALRCGIKYQEYFGVSGSCGFLSGDARVDVSCGASKCLSNGMVIHPEMSTSFSNVKPEPRAPAVGMGGGGNNFSFGVTLDGSSQFLNSVLSNAFQNVGMGGFTATANLTGSFNMSVNNKNRKVLGAYHLPRYGTGNVAGDDVEMDLITERDGFHDREIEGDSEARKTAKYEGMVHLGQDMYAINADGLNGSMKIQYDEEIELREAQGTSFSLNTTLSLPIDDLESTLTSLPQLLSSISVSGVYSKRSFQGGAPPMNPRFLLAGDSREGSFRVTPDLEEDLFKGFDIVNPKGDLYQFQHPVMNSYMYSWSSSRPPSPTANATMVFSNMFSDGGEYSMGYNLNEESYAYAWKLTDIQRRDGSRVSFRYGSGLNNFHWRTPLIGTGPVTSVTETNRSQVSFGTKELDYLQVIETDTHFGYFILDDREDAISLTSDMQDAGLPTGVDLTSLGRQKYLRTFFLIEKAGLEEAILTALQSHSYTHEQIISLAQLKSRIRKQIEFEYDYHLCEEVPNSRSSNINPNQGKLTLKKIEILGSNAGENRPKDIYEFAYFSEYWENDVNVPFNYNPDTFDRWGYYCPDRTSDYGAYYRHVTIPPSLTFKDSYAESATVPASAAWSLRSIKTPLGTHLVVDYEGGSYLYSGENVDLSGEVPGGAPRVQCVRVLSEQVGSTGTSFREEKGTSYTYEQGSTLREPRGYLGETLEDGGAFQDLDDPELLAAWHEDLPDPAVDLGVLRRSLMQNGNFNLPGPDVIYGHVIEYPRSDRQGAGGMTVHDFATAQLTGNPQLLQTSYRANDEFPPILRYFQYIGLRTEGRGACFKIKVFGHKFVICLLRHTWDPLFWTPILTCIAHGQPLHMFCFGEDKGKAQKLFGPFGRDLQAFIEITWDIQSYQYTYDLTDHASFIGSPLSQSVYDAQGHLLSKTEELYFLDQQAPDPLRLASRLPLMCSYRPDAPSMVDSLVIPGEMYKQGGKAFTFGLAITPRVGAVPPFDMSLTLLVDTEIRKRTNKYTLPVISLGRRSTLYDPILQTASVTETRNAGFDPRTLQPVLITHTSPALPNRLVYELNVPAFRLNSALEEANILGDTGLKVTGVLQDGQYQPLRGSQTQWQELPLGSGANAENVWVPATQSVWNGGGTALTLSEPDNPMAWSALDEILSVDEQGQPREQQDALGTVSSIFKDNQGRIRGVAVNAGHSDVILNSFDTAGDQGILGGHLVLDGSGNSTCVAQLPASPYPRTLDLLIRSNKYSKEGIRVFIPTDAPPTTVWQADLPVTPVWTSFRVEIPPLLMDESLYIRLAEANQADVDELRVYPATALLKTFGYEATRSAPTFILDENAQATWYETTSREELRSIHNMRRELLNLYYYRKQHEGWEN